jgi:[acyl-carrier-protein] S-malonyltransferase
MTVGLFPGQGIPARTVAQVWPESHPVLEAADDILGYDLKRKTSIASRRAKAALPTSLAQPAIFVAGIISFQAAESDGKSYESFAGHSLGEYTALVAAGAMSFESGLEAVMARGEAMHEASRSTPGQMAAILGLDFERALEIADETNVVLANDNAPGQVVLSGGEDGLARAAQLVSGAGGRAVLLDVAGPFHTLAMAPAAPALRDVLARVEISVPSVPVVSNVTAAPYESVEQIRSLLVRQLTDRVRFRESLEWLWGRGARNFEDLGPGRVVAGLAQRTFDYMQRTKEAARA